MHKITRTVSDGENPIQVKGKKVAIIGGGETAPLWLYQCCHYRRSGAVTQIDYEKLPTAVDLSLMWPDWRKIKRTSTSQEEGCVRLFATNTTAFVGDNTVKSLNLQKVKWGQGRNFSGIEGTGYSMDVDVVLIAMGYAHPSAHLATEFKLETDKRGNLKAATEGKHAYQTSNPKIFAAGDGRKGQSLVVYAIAEGRECAKSVQRYLENLD